MKSHLTSLLLPKDCRLWVSFGFTWEGGGAALGHNLVPWTDDKLRGSCSQRVKVAVLVHKWNTAKPNVMAGDYRGLGSSSRHKQYTT